MIGRVVDGRLVMSEEERAQFRALWNSLPRRRRAFIRDMAVDDEVTIVAIYHQYPRLFEVEGEGEFEE